MDVGEWLKGIGLGQYEARFREHEIDAEVLPELTEADLEKFGLALMPNLSSIARRADLNKLIAEVLASNAAMLKCSRRAASK